MVKHRVAKKILSFCRNHGLIDEKNKILVGFSGGIDSTFLLLLLFLLKDELEIEVAAAHINYNLRGLDSVKDQEFCEEFCSCLELPLQKKNINLTKTNQIEETARDIRFDFFYTLVKTHGYDKIALGHNKDDQAETVMFNLLRGSGFLGASGIKPQREIIIHPLLSLSRVEIQSFLDKFQISYRVDKTNQEAVFTRNKIRNELFPWVKKNINSKSIDNLYRFSKLSWHSEDFFEKYSLDYLRDKADLFFGSVVLYLDNFKCENPVCQFFIIRNSIKKLDINHISFNHKHFENITKILRSEGSKQISLFEGITIFKEYNKLTIQKKQKGFQDNSERDCIIDEIKNTTIEYESNSINFEIINNKAPEVVYCKSRNVCFMDLDKIDFPLMLTKKKPGDFFKPLGMSNFKKLKDFFIDEKISKYERGKVDILRDSKKILWVISHRIDDRVKVDNNTKNYLKITINKNNKDV